MRPLKIEVCENRKQSVLQRGAISWEKFCDYLSKTTRGEETLEQYLQMSKAEQTEKKDVGGFVGGELKDGRRKKGSVLSRSMLTLDMDSAEPDTWANIKSKFHSCCCVYSTRKHTPDKPRLRLIIPLARDVTSKEYEAVARLVADQIGMEVFDPTTFEPERLMFFPSTCADGEFLFDHIDGPWLDPDKCLAMYKDWENASTWPQPIQQIVNSPKKGNPPVHAESVHEAGCEQADPLKKPGIIGAFCRAYFPIASAIDTFLPDVYMPSAVEGRYDYIPADSAGGVVIYEDKFSYSHHATDPLCGKLLNAFDLVRLHKFGHLDADCPPDTPVGGMPSFKAMTDLALNDEKVKSEFDSESGEQLANKFDVIEDDGSDADSEDSGGDGDIADDGDGSGGGNGNGNSGGGGSSNNGNGSNNGTGGAGGSGGNNWIDKLERDKYGNVMNTLTNLLAILKYDPWLQGIAYNVLSDTFEVRGKVPWNHPQKGWRDADDAQLVSYINFRYGRFSANLCSIALAKVADDRSFHPVREYIQALPAWDGVARVETLLIDYLGAEDNEFVRAVTRKTLCAAICRALHPGCKFDYVLVLVGPQGVGKSTLIARLGGEWFSDSLTFNDLRDKTAAEKLQGTWICELGELAGMKKAEVETIRSFISRQDDQYRAAFAKRPTSHPRNCIFIGTTNAETGFLRDTTGNRRFWPVATPGNGGKRSGDLSDDEIQQIWAEALEYVNRGEKLYLDKELESKAEEAQRGAMEYDDREGMVLRYLETPLPKDWEKRNIAQRLQYLRLPGPEDGKTKRDRVCNMEIWCECFGNQQSSITSKDSREITAIMARLGWKKETEKGKGKARFPLYGPQSVYTRP